MKRYVITLDGGTTNTRAVLWNAEGVPVDSEKEEVGVRNTAIDGNNLRLKQAVKLCIETLLQRNNLDFIDVNAIYASGMITSNVGLVEVPHLVAPAGTSDFVVAVKRIDLPEVAPIPFHFIPGLKNMADGITLDNVEGMDIMRGEEVEAMALLHWLPMGKAYLLVLPGSHTKFITVDAKGRLTGCLTSMAGELLSLLTTQSILADAVKHSFVAAETYEKKKMLAGFRTARATSFSRAAFSTRIMSLFVARDAPAQCASFLLGAVLESDVAAVKGSKALTLAKDMEVVVAGKEPLRSSLVDVFVEDGTFRRVQAFTPPEGVVMSAYGAYLVARVHGFFDSGLDR